VAQEVRRAAEAAASSRMVVFFMWMVKRIGTKQGWTTDYSNENGKKDFRFTFMFLWF
jgi:hypothetical protein